MIWRWRPLHEPLRRLLRKVADENDSFEESFEGTATELLEALADVVDKSTRLQKSWAAKWTRTIKYVAETCPESAQSWLRSSL
jgi:hypothetical protein